jgi:hypothetical protein
LLATKKACTAKSLPATAYWPGTPSSRAGKTHAPMILTLDEDVE